MHTINVKDILNKHMFTVLFSGGKDSTTTLLWVYNNVRHNKWNVLFVEMVGNTSSLCVEYVYGLIGELGLKDRFIHAKTEDFFELCRRWGMPIFKGYRWCKTLKLEQFKKHSHHFQVVGIKKSDSRLRSRFGIVSYYRSTKNVGIHPILEWNDEQVMEYLKENNVSLNPCYKIYGHSGNCMFCPYADKRHIILTMKDKHWRNKIIEILSDKRNEKGKFGRFIRDRWLSYSKQMVLR